MTKKTIFTFCLILTVFSNIQAQVATWIITPGKYDKIERCWYNLLYVYKGDKIGIVDEKTGREIVPVEASAFTGFYNNLALEVKQTSNKSYQIIGILSKGGEFTQVEGTYYAIPNQMFFSEGLLTVVDSKGHAGYMNTKGKIEKMFQEHFAAPFCEGYAVVGKTNKGDKVSIVNRRFQRVQIRLDSNGDIYDITNCNNKYIYIHDSFDSWFKYDISGKNIAIKQKPGSFKHDYLYRYDTREPETVPEEYFEDIYKKLSTSSKEKKIKNHQGKIPLHNLFDNIEPQFEYFDHVIVTYNGKVGLLSFDINGTFAATTINPDIKYKRSKAKDIPHIFNLSMPDNLDVDNLSISVTDPNGRDLYYTRTGNQYSFTADAVIDKATYLVKVVYDGLTQYEGYLTYHYQQEADPIVVTNDNNNLQPAKLEVSLKMENINADKNNRCYVIATIKNPNSVSVTTPVSITGSKLLKPESKTVTIPPKGTTIVKTYFTVNKAAIEYVTVKVSGATKTLSGIQLKRFGK